MSDVHIKDNQFLLIGILLSLVTFFWNADRYADHYKHVENHEYQKFSATIFKPQQAFYAESILLPMIGKVLGASKSAYAYQMLTAILQFLILPFVALVFVRRISSDKLALIMLIIFVISFLHLKNYYLGFPDPLTMLCLLVAANAPNSKVLFFAVLGSTLSHYTLTIFGLAAWFLILLSQAVETRAWGAIARKIVYCLLAVISGKIILTLWFVIFDYQLMSRFAYIDHRGLDFFIKKYNDNPIAFWLTPGLGFIIINLMILFLLILNRWQMALGQLGALFMAYLCLFLSEDGLRIFSVVIVVAYVVLLSEIVPQTLKHLYKTYPVLRMPFPKAGK